VRAEALTFAAAGALLCCAAPLAAAPPGGPVMVTGIERYQYLSPVPGSQRVSPRNNVVIRLGAALDPASVARGLLTVTGSISGSHSGRLVLSDDRKTIVYRPDLPFALGEAVSVRLEPGVETADGGSLPAVSFGFTISASDPSQMPATIPEEFSWLRRAAPADPRQTDIPPDPGAPYSTPCDSLPTHYPAPVVLASNDPGSGAVFIAPFKAGNNDERLLIIDNSGAPLFYRSVSGVGPAFDFKRQPDGRLTYYLLQPSRFIVLDSTYAVVDSFETGNGYVTDVHELQLLPNGHALLMSYDLEPVDMSVYVTGGDPNARVYGLILQELDSAKNVVFQWRSWDHFAFTDCASPGVPLTGSVIDYVHGNAIELDADGNLLLSSRHMNEITKIDRQTGSIIWRLGLNAVNNEFTFLNDSRGFSHQHDIRRLPNGHITLYDNGNYMTPAYSRAVEYSLDEVGKVAVQVWEYRNAPDVFGGFMGNVQRHTDGATFIGWGGTFTNPKVTEVHADGSTAFEVGFQDPGLLSYRAFRYPWQTTRFVTSADTVDFRGVGLGTRPTLPLSVRNNSGATITINCVQSTNPAFFVSGSVPATLAPGDSVDLTVSFLPPNEADQTGTLYLRQVTDNELVARPVMLHGRGSAVLGVNGRTDSGSLAVVSRPNPFRGLSRIGLVTPRAGRVRLDILDVHGRTVATLLDGFRPAGSYEAEWRPGSRPDGMYFARLRVGEQMQSRKLVLMK
jgi:hypothetical protein